MLGLLCSERSRTYTHRSIFSIQHDKNKPRHQDAWRVPNPLAVFPVSIEADRFASDLVQICFPLVVCGGVMATVVPEYIADGTHTALLFTYRDTCSECMSPIFRLFPSDQFCESSTAGMSTRVTCEANSECVALFRNGAKVSGC